jgi:hypothetical protein
VSVNLDLLQSILPKSLQADTLEEGLRTIIERNAWKTQIQKYKRFLKLERLAAHTFNVILTNPVMIPERLHSISE